MDLPATIYAQAQSLPVELQREALDFIGYLAQRYQTPPTNTRKTNTDAFIARFAGSVGSDFPDDVKQADLAEDIHRESLE